MVGAGDMPMATPRVWWKIESPNCMQLFRMTIFNASSTALQSYLSQNDEKNSMIWPMLLFMSMLVYIYIAMALNVIILALGWWTSLSISCFKVYESLK